MSLHPYWQHYEGRCVNLDSRVVLYAAPPSSLRVIITDPPYNIGYVSNRAIGGASKPIEGDRNHDFSWLKEAYRVTQDGGLMLLWTRWDVYPTWKAELEKVGYQIRACITWVKRQHTSGNLKGAPGFRQEWCIMAVRGNFVGPWVTIPEVKRPSDVIILPESADERGGLRVHPTQKPEALLDELVMSYTTEGEFVFDPFAGSGSTLKAAQKYGRPFAGVEIDPIHCRGANTGLSQTSLL